MEFTKKEELDSLGDDFEWFDLWWLCNRFIKSRLFWNDIGFLRNMKGLYFWELCEINSWSIDEIM